ncbi:MAG TPA: decarboxylating 6-phosphogluconate dehydrogenase [Patescibacteria group bacterium]|nr:decarboxylating 6-phosphogluconate dehydrogenase [Patescibacteria group bacterium]
MKIGFIGLGKMGTGMALKLFTGGHDVLVWNRSQEAVDSIMYQVSSIKEDKKIHDTKYKLPDTTYGDLESADSIESLVKQLQTPRVIWVMLPAGDATENALQEIAKHVEKGDIVIDGGNAFYKDTQRRYEALRAKGIEFLGIGVSGGIKASERGYPLMVGGSKEGFEFVRPLLETLIKPHGGYEYFGEGGAGHFVKMVHNGIEYGMMQAIGEGYGVLEKAPYSLDLVKVAQLWQKNTIVTSFLNECARDALEKDPTLAGLDGVIDATGEAEWTVNQAKDEGVYAENIDQSLDFRRRSKTDPQVSSSFAARMVAALRHEFGGHAVQKTTGDAQHKVKEK